MAIKIKFIIFLSIMLVLCSYSAYGQLASQQPQIASVTGTCAERWDCTAWEGCYQGISERKCFDLNQCYTANEMPAEIASCQDVLPYCYDKIINQDETDVDCGGLVCDACRLGKACFKDRDCAEGSCIKGKCNYETEESAVAAVPAPISLTDRTLAITAAVLVLAIVFVAFSLIKKLKRQKIIVLVNKKEEVKEEIQIFSPKKMTKKSKASKFIENVNGYLKSLKPESGPKQQPVYKTEEKKALLNENSFKNKAYPAKEFMLSNLKEAYNND